MENIARDYRTEIAPTRARFIRIKARDSAKIPAWHPGAGGDPYIFVDEFLFNRKLKEAGIRGNYQL